MKSQEISKSLLRLLNEKVTKINKKSLLKELKEQDIKDLKSYEVILGVYKIEDSNGNFLVYKIFISSDLQIKGSYKEYNLIANALLTKNAGREKIAAKINIYNSINNNKFLNTFVEFVKNKLNIEDDDLKPGEYILQGLKLGDLLEIEI